MPNPMTALKGLKSKSDSKGIIGGILSLIGFGLAATVLSRWLGIEVKKTDLEGISENVQLIQANWAAWVALIGAAIGLWGNWVREAKIGFGSDEKNPAKSKGIMGNLMAILAGIWAFTQSVGADWSKIQELIGTGKEQWEIVAPAVLGIFGTLQGMWGRWRAKKVVSGSTITVSPGLPLILIPILFLSISCASGSGTSGETTISASEVGDKTVEGFSPDSDVSAITVRDGIIAGATAAIIEAVKFHGTFKDGHLCGSVTLFGFGPEVCLGLEIPDNEPEPEPEQRLIELDQQIAAIQQDFIARDADLRAD